MTGNEIAELASAYLQGDPIDTALLFINDCLLELGEDARVSGSQTLIADAGVSYGLPDTAITVYRVEKSNTAPCNEYTTRNRVISFNSSDIYTVYFYKLPTLLNSLSDSLEVSELFKHPMALYVASRHLDNKEDGDQNKAAAFYAQYLEAKPKATKGSEVSKKSGRRVKKGVWR